jgi:nickel-dependent lactate racemase
MKFKIALLLLTLLIFLSGCATTGSGYMPKKENSSCKETSRLLSKHRHQQRSGSHSNISRDEMLVLKRMYRDCKTIMNASSNDYQKWEHLMDEMKTLENKALKLKERFHEINQ